MRGGPLLCLAVLLVGCLQTGDAPTDVETIGDPCSQGVCPAEGHWPDEADAPVGATPVLVFDAGQVPWVSELVRTMDGPAWIATRDDGPGGQVSVVEAYNDGSGTLQRYRAPFGHTASGLLAQGDTVWFTVAATGSRDNGTLVQWDLDTGIVHSTPMPGVPLPWRVVSAGPDGILVVSQRAALTGQEALWWVSNGSVNPLVSAEGRFVLGAMAGPSLFAAQLVDDTYRLVMTGTTPASDRHVLWQDRNDTIVGVYANAGRVAFSTLGPGDQPGEAVLWEVDPHNHAVMRLTTGWDARFVGDLVYHVGQEPGGKPYVRAWNPALGGTAPAFFLPNDRQAWAATADGVWWLDTPTTDHRFDGLPNPTSFSTVLFKR